MKLVVCDVDEVVLHYFCYLRERLDQSRHSLERDGFDLRIRDLATGHWLEQRDSDIVSDEVLRNVVGDQAAIIGAVENLQWIAKETRVLFLSNIRDHLLEDRKKCLSWHGLPFQIVKNVGGKGHSVAEIVRNIRPESVLVVDDSVRQLTNVRKHVPDAHLIRAILTPETRSLASDSQFVAASTWSEILDLVANFHNHKSSEN